MAFFMFEILGSILGFLPMVVFMFKGKGIKERLGAPKNVNALNGHDAKAVELDKLGEENEVYDEGRA